MDIERELGIGPTSDKREIRRAYARRLKETHPEDDPEGFQRLRAAYEAGLQQADWIAEDEAEEDADEDENERAMAPDRRPARRESVSAGGDPGAEEHEDDSADGEPDDGDRRAVAGMVAGLGRLLDKDDDSGAAEALEIAVGDPVLLNLNNRRLFEFLLLQEIGERDPMPPATAKAAVQAFRWNEHWTDLPYEYQYLADQVLAVQLFDERLAELRRAAKKRIAGGFEARAANLLLGPYSPIRFTLAGGADLLTAMGHLLAELRAQHPEILKREVDPRVLAWWTDATDDPASRINRRSRMVTWTIIGISFALGVARAVLSDF